MSADIKAQWHLEGSKMIIDYCNMLAGRIGINLKKVYWTAENPGDEKLIKHILTIEAENGAIQLLFGAHDIATFPTKVDYAARTQRKLQKAMFGFRTDI